MTRGDFCVYFGTGFAPLLMVAGPMSAADLAGGGPARQTVTFGQGHRADSAGEMPGIPSQGIHGYHVAGHV